MSPKRRGARPLNRVSPILREARETMRGYSFADPIAKQARLRVLFELYQTAPSFARNEIADMIETLRKTLSPADSPPPADSNPTSPPTSSSNPKDPK